MKTKLIALFSLVFAFSFTSINSFADSISSSLKDSQEVSDNETEDNEVEKVEFKEINEKAKDPTQVIKEGKYVLEVKIIDDLSDANSYLKYDDGVVEKFYSLRKAVVTQVYKGSSSLLNSTITLSENVALKDNVYYYSKANTAQISLQKDQTYLVYLKQPNKNNIYSLNGKKAYYVNTSTIASDPLSVLSYLKYYAPTTTKNKSELNTIKTTSLKDYSGSTIKSFKVHDDDLTVETKYIKSSNKTYVEMNNKAYLVNGKVSYK